MIDLEASRLRWDEDARGWPDFGVVRTVDAKGLRWRVQIAGEGPDLLLLHGAGGSGHSWAALLPRLAKEYRVINPDLPGHAFTSGLPAERTTLPEVAAAILGLVEALGVRPGAIVTHSAAAALALSLIEDGRLQPRAWAAYAPSLVPPSKGLPPPAVKDLLTPLLRTSSLAFLSAAIGRYRRVADGILDSTGSRVPEDSRARYRQLVGNPAHVGSVIRTMAGWDPEPVSRRFSDVQVPGLAVAGDADGWIPLGEIREAVSRLPTAQLRVVPGRGHLLHEEVPDRALGLLLPFLRDALGTVPPRTGRGPGD